MRFLRRVAAITAAAVVVPVSLAAPASADAAGECVATTGLPALEVAPEFHAPVDVAAGFHRLWDMKVAWKDVNPSPGVFDWSILDKRINEALTSAGSPRVLYVMGLTPQWAAANPGAGDPRWGAGTASPPATISTWTSYVEAVVSRFGGKIDAYEIWNEANLSTFWQGSPQQLADMTKVAYDIIKAGDPSATVLTPSVTTRLQGSAYRFNSSYIPALLEVGGGTIPADAFAVHTYPRGDLGTIGDAIRQRAEDVRAYQANIRDLLARVPAEAGKPLWDTEVNYGLRGPGIIPGRDWSDAEGAMLLLGTYGSSAALGIDQTFWYQYTVAPQALLGVQFTPQTPAMREAWSALPGWGAGACPTSGLNRGLLSGGEGSWITDINNTITAKASRVAPGSPLVKVRAEVTGLPNDYPLQLQILMPGYTTWQKVKGRPVVKDGVATRTIKTPKSFRIRWVTESGNVVSNVVRVPDIR